MPVPPPMFHPQQFVKQCYDPQSTNRQNLEHLKDTLAAQLKQIDDTLDALENTPKP